MRNCFHLGDEEQGIRESRLPPVHILSNRRRHLRHDGDIRSWRWGHRRGRCSRHWWVCRWGTRAGLHAYHRSQAWRAESHQGDGFAFQVAIVITGEFIKENALLTFVYFFHRLEARASHNRFVRQSWWGPWHPWEATAAISATCIEELCDRCDCHCRCRDVPYWRRLNNFAEVGDIIHETDTGGRHGLAGIFDHLGTGDVGENHAVVGDHKRQQRRDMICGHARSRCLRRHGRDSKSLMAPSPRNSGLEATSKSTCTCHVYPSSVCMASFAFTAVPPGTVALWLQGGYIYWCAVRRCATSSTYFKSAVFIRAVYLQRKRQHPHCRGMWWGRWVGEVCPASPFLTDGSSRPGS